MFQTILRASVFICTVDRIRQVRACYRRNSRHAHSCHYDPHVDSHRDRERERETVRHFIPITKATVINRTANTT